MRPADDNIVDNARFQSRRSCEAQESCQPACTIAIEAGSGMAPADSVLPFANDMKALAADGLRGKITGNKEACLRLSTFQDASLVLTILPRKLKQKRALTHAIEEHRVDPLATHTTFSCRHTSCQRGRRHDFGSGAVRAHTVLYTFTKATWAACVRTRDCHGPRAFVVHGAGLWASACEPLTYAKAITTTAKLKVCRFFQY